MVERVKVHLLTRYDIGMNKLTWLTFSNDVTHEEYSGTIFETEIGKTIRIFKHTEGIGPEKSCIYERIEYPDYLDGYESMDVNIYPWMIAFEEPDNYTIDEILDIVNKI